LDEAYEFYENDYTPKSQAKIADIERIGKTQK
jgi:hypothetical protein